MQVREKPIEAQGPDGLLNVLKQLHHQGSIRTIHYKIGDAEAYIYADMTRQSSPEFYYTDVDKRRASPAVKELLAKFLWNIQELRHTSSFEVYLDQHFEKHFRDFYDLEADKVVQETYSGGRSMEELNRDKALERLYNAIESKAWDKIPQESKKTTAWMNLFSNTAPPKPPLPPTNPTLKSNHGPKRSS